MQQRRRDGRTAAATRWAAVSSRARIGVMAAVGAAAAVAVGLLDGQWPYALLAGWDVAALVFTVWVWVLLATADPAATAAHARREDPGRAATDLLVLLAAVANLASVGYVLVQAGASTGATQDLLAGLGVLGVVLSWFVVHTLYSLRYARLYFAGQPGGVDFDQSVPPRYLDFAYLSFTVGMTFQVSDTSLQTPAIRACALRQALLAYLFGAVIIAATINLVSQLATKG